MSVPVLCERCHKPVRSAAARGRRIGSGCWRRLRPDQRAAIRRDPFRVRAILTRPAPTTTGQLPLHEEESTSA
ncbi:hypothetical protein [Streptomyces antibioticus]|uniref:hypothetical protein n=1 Tax=Streptomyces antibioticus TaxID=1890 RepID=UPI0033A7B0FB